MQNETVEWYVEMGADVNGMRDLVAESGPHPDRDTAHDVAMRALGKTVGEIFTLSDVSLCPMDKGADPSPSWRVAGVSIMEVSSEYGTLHDTIEDFEAAPTEEDERVRLACATCWEYLGQSARFVDHVTAPFARCDLCGTAGEDEEIIEYEWKEA